MVSIELDDGVHKINIFEGDKVEAVVKQFCKTKSNTKSLIRFRIWREGVQEDFDECGGTDKAINDIELMIILTFNYIS